MYGRDQDWQTKREPRDAATPEQIDNWVEHSIKAAQRRGDFDNLPGAGKPLDLDADQNDPDWWLRRKIQREKIDISAALPGPMALRLERSTFPDSLLHLADEGAVREVLLDFNERVLADRRRPVAALQSPAVVGRVNVEAMLSHWRELKAERLRENACEIRVSGHEDLRAHRRRWWRWGVE